MASAMLRGGDGTAAQLMALLRYNAFWRMAGEAGRSGALDIGGAILLGAGAAVGGWQNYSTDRRSHGIAVSVAEATVQTAGDVGISFADVGVFAEAGAGIGSLVGPEGTLIGAGVGALAGAAVAYFQSNAFNNGINLAGNAIGGAVSDVAKFFGF